MLHDMAAREIRQVTSKMDMGKGTQRRVLWRVGYDLGSPGMREVRLSWTCTHSKLSIYDKGAGLGEGTLEACNTARTPS